MSRRGVEEKPLWSSVPEGVRERVGEIAGARVTRGERVWGGYGPTPTFRLRLADGSRLFVKATSPDSDDFPVRALEREERNYRELAPFIAAWSPTFHGAFRLEGWHVLVLDDVGPKSIPPWTPTTAKRAAHGLAGFHASTRGQELPAWLARPWGYLGSLDWDRVEARTEGFAHVGRLAGAEEDSAVDWLRRARDILNERLKQWERWAKRGVLLHDDVRSDNLRLRGTRLILFDWPHARVGPPEFDLAQFAQSVAVDGGPRPDDVTCWYVERGEVDAEALDGSIAWWAAFFADSAWRPDVPGLPRLRSFQRQQLRVLLGWASRRLRLPTPNWAEKLAP